MEYLLSAGTIKNQNYLFKKIVMWSYKGKLFKNQKEIKDKLGFSGAVFRAKVRDKEIVRINNINTGLEPYEKLYNSNE